MYEEKFLRIAHFLDYFFFLLYFRVFDPNIDLFKERKNNYSLLAFSEFDKCKKRRKHHKMSLVVLYLIIGLPSSLKKRGPACESEKSLHPAPPY